ncbi:MAG: nitroreductase family protein [Patescibacteria group bacterium]
MNTQEKIIEARTPKTKKPNVLDVIKKRFSPHIYSSKEISNDDLATIFEAARLAPSSRNFQPWYFYFFRQNNSSFQKVVACLSEGNKWASKAPTLIIACHIPIDESGIEIKTSKYDLGLAAMSLVLQAHDMGYYCRQMGGFDREKLSETVIPNKHHKPMTLITLGLLGSDKDFETVDVKLIEMDMRASGRKEKIFEEII